jgi:hypothetical protein
LGSNPSLTGDHLQFPKETLQQIYIRDFNARITLIKPGVGEKSPTQNKTPTPFGGDPPDKLNETIPIYDPSKITLFITLNIQSESQNPGLLQIHAGQ